MSNEILNMVKEHFDNHPAIANIPADQQDAIHNEIATHVANSLANQTADQGQINSGQGNTVTGIASGLLGKLENAVAGGGTVTSAIEGGLVSSLASKFGLPPSITGAIAGALPGLLQKFASKAKAPGI